MRCWSALVTAIVLALPMACASPASSTTVELQVFAGASLGPALEAARDVYVSSIRAELGRPALTITVTTDSSAALRTQIEQGAPADLFLAADTKNPQALVDAGLTNGEAVVFAANLLAIIVPIENPAGVTSPAGIAKPGIKIIAAGDEVPITKYANQLLENLAALPGYPADFEAAYAANVVSREDNVRAVVAKIEAGEGDVGIVYVSDAAASDGVIGIEVPVDANVPATYAGVVVKGSNLNLQAAHAFLAWLAGASGQSVLAGFGFLPPPA